MIRQLRISGSDDIEVEMVDVSLGRNPRGEIEVLISKPGYYGVPVYKLYIERNGTISGKSIRISTRLKWEGWIRGILNVNSQDKVDL